MNARCIDVCWGAYNRPYRDFSSPLPRCRISGGVISGVREAFFCAAAAGWTGLRTILLGAGLKTGCCASPVRTHPAATNRGVGGSRSRHRGHLDRAARFPSHWDRTGGADFPVSAARLRLSNSWRRRISCGDRANQRPAERQMLLIRPTRLVGLRATAALTGGDTPEVAWNCPAFACLHRQRTDPASGAAEPPSRSARSSRRCADYEQPFRACIAPCCHGDYFGATEVPRERGS